MFGTNRAPILHWHQQRLQMERNEISQDPRHIGLPSGVSQIISKPMVRSAQTMHLSCVKISTISKWTKTSFQLSLVTKEYQCVRPKWFLSPWHVWCKPCTYLPLTLTPSPNRPKWDSTRPTSPRSFVKCIQNDFWAYGTIEANRAPILRQD
jgi:hypothetical protein